MQYHSRSKCYLSYTTRTSQLYIKLHYSSAMTFCREQCVDKLNKLKVEFLIPVHVWLPYYNNFKLHLKCLVCVCCQLFQILKQIFKVQVPISNE